MEALAQIQASTTEVGAFLGLTAQRIRQLIDSGHMARLANGKLLLVSAVQGYIRFLKDEGRRASKSAAAGGSGTGEHEGRLIDLQEVLAGPSQATLPGGSAEQPLLSIFQVFKSAVSIRWR